MVKRAARLGKRPVFEGRIVHDRRYATPFVVGYSFRRYDFGDVNRTRERRYGHVGGVRFVRNATYRLNVRDNSFVRELRRRIFGVLYHRAFLSATRTEPCVCVRRDKVRVIKMKNTRVKKNIVHVTYLKISSLSLYISNIYIDSYLRVYNI